MKKATLLVSLSLLAVSVLALSLIFGCGSNPTGGGGGGGASNDGSTLLLGNNVRTVKHGTSSSISGSVAATKTITGYVKEAFTGTPIVGAIVMAKGPTGAYVSALTDSNGNYSLPGVRTGVTGISTAKNTYNCITVNCDADEVYFNLFKMGSFPAENAAIDVYLYHWTGSTYEAADELNAEALDPEHNFSHGWGSNYYHDSCEVPSGTPLKFFAYEYGYGGSDLVDMTLSAGEVRTIEAYVGRYRGTINGSVNSIPSGLDRLSSRVEKQIPHCLLSQTLSGTHEEMPGTSFHHYVNPGTDYLVRGWYYMEDSESYYPKSSGFTKKVSAVGDGGTVDVGPYDLLDPPVITKPDESTLTPTIEWGAVTGSQMYFVVVQPYTSEVSGNTFWLGITSGTTVEYPPFPDGYGSPITNGKLLIAAVNPQKFDAITPDLNNINFGNMVYDLEWDSQDSKLFTPSVP